MVGAAVWPPDEENSDTKHQKSESSSVSSHFNVQQCDVSIIIAARNNGKFLVETIESALAQTIPCELIYADDCSFDDSLQIAQQYESRGVKILPCEAHTGVCETRNRGAAAAQSDYLVFLDGDDVLSPDFVEKHLQVMRPETPFVYGAAQAFGDFSTFWDAPEWEDGILWRHNFVNTTAMWNRLAFEAAGRWRDGIKTMWDWDLALRGARLGTPRRSQAVLNYRQHADSWSANNSEKYKEEKTLLMPRVRRMNSRLSVGTIFSGRISKLFPRWISAVAQAVRLIDTFEPTELVLLDNSDNQETRSLLRAEGERYYSTFETIRILSHPAKILYANEIDRRNKTSRFMADAYNRLRTEMRGDVHWLIEDDIFVPLEGGEKLFSELMSGWIPPHAVSGCYRNRHVPTQYVGGHFHDDCPVELRELPADPFPIDFAGTGCLMFWNSRTPKFWDSHYQDIPAHDWNWCMRLKERDGTLLMLPSVRCKHAVDSEEIIEG